MSIQYQIEKEKGENVDVQDKANELRVEEAAKELNYFNFKIESCKKDIKRYESFKKQLLEGRFEVERTGSVVYYDE